MSRSLTEILTHQGYQNASAMILAGRVLVDGVRETRSGLAVRENARIEVLPGRDYVSRGAHKLLGAFSDFAVSGLRPPVGRVCLDLGASHGGFTQVLLECDAARVYAIDVAYGILDYEVRRDRRVVALEKRNARQLAPDWLSPEDLQSSRQAADGRSPGIFVTGDLSFISLRRILDALARFARDGRVSLEILMLIKPQFEQPDATNKGVLEDEQLRDAIVAGVLDYARELGFREARTKASRLPGAKGNVEYFLYATI
ncbi:MAG: TlyA family RNA methyltransferase [Leptospirales bacterium]|jgi:23S rRNA (cytidine1920-2'-O)/16S rRNA (cytidine1409-2'-O)-methyltransferase